MEKLWFRAALGYGSGLVCLPKVTCSGTEGQGTSSRRKQKASPPRLTAALLTMAKRWQHPKCPSTGEWRNTKWSLYMMENYSALKRKKTLTYAYNRVNLENIMLNEINQLEKGKYCMIALLEGTQSSQSHRDRVAVVPRGRWGRKGGVLVSNGDRVSVL